MTAQDMVDRVARQLTGLKISDTSVPANEATLLGFLNSGVKQIAEDTLLWLNGEQITMTTANEYTLSLIPIQIIDVYDDKLNMRPRNSTHSNGYYQLSPKVIYVNSPEVDTVLNINYYYAPADYVLTDVIEVPPVLEIALEHFMKHLAFDIYKSEKEIVQSEKYLGKYETSKNKFLSKTDNGNLDSVLEIDPISQKGLV